MGRQIHGMETGLFLKSERESTLAPFYLLYFSCRLEGEAACLPTYLSLGQTYSLFHGKMGYGKWERDGDGSVHFQFSVLVLFREEGDHQHRRIGG